MHGTMKIMDTSGHTQLQWDPNVPNEVQAAKEAFATYVAKGYSAFRVGSDGEKSTRMEKFDPSAEEMILVPQLKGG